MFYKPVSVREAVNSINDIWFLPAIQRPYDWGERNKKEGFIYKLFDSLIRRYPIGTMILWETKKPIPFRDFLKDYNSEKLERIKDKGLWSSPNKHLIYDGQQRLQSLYSCLKYTFHNMVLCFDLLFDMQENKEPEGFRFFKKNEKIEPKWLRINELFAWKANQYTDYEEKILSRIKMDVFDKNRQKMIRTNIRNLWTIFVEEDIKLLSYYPLDVDLNEKEVLDIFKRINTTGMVLTKSEILFSDIKRIKYDFEEDIWKTCFEIKQITNGYSLSPDEVLQILFLLIKDGVRVDPERIDESELQQFKEKWTELKSPLKSFFSDFLYEEYKINHEKIINLKKPLIPLIVYFYYMRTLHSIKYRDFTSSSIENMKKYFVISQLKYWDMDSYIDNIHRIIKELANSETGIKKLEFPFNKIRKEIKDSGKRDYNITADDFDDRYLRWFILKILVPNKEYIYIKDPDERFNPEIDHIFPLTPKSEKEYPNKYYRWVDTIWNLQPVKGDVNGAKLNEPPSEFFSKYPKYLKQYDFLPNKNPKSSIWRDEYAKEYIIKRKKKILKYFRKEYSLMVY